MININKINALTLITLTTVQTGIFQTLTVLTITFLILVVLTSNFLTLFVLTLILQTCMRSCPPRMKLFVSVNFRQWAWPDRPA